MLFNKFKSNKLVLCGLCSHFHLFKITITVYFIKYLTHSQHFRLILKTIHSFALFYTITILFILKFRLYYKLFGIILMSIFFIYSLLVNLWRLVILNRILCQKVDVFFPEFEGLIKRYSI